MTDSSLPPESIPATSAPSAADSNEHWQARLSRVEAQLRALQERVGELSDNERSRKQRALVLRLVLLALLLGLFFAFRAWS